MRPAGADDIDNKQSLLGAIGFNAVLEANVQLADTVAPFIENFLYSDRAVHKAHKDLLLSDVTISEYLTKAEQARLPLAKVIAYNLLEPLLLGERARYAEHRIAIENVIDDRQECWPGPATGLASPAELHSLVDAYQQVDSAFKNTLKQLEKERSASLGKLPLQGRGIFTPTGPAHDASDKNF